MQAYKFTGIEEFTIIPNFNYGTSTVIEQYRVVERQGILCFVGNFIECYNFILKYSSLTNQILSKE